MKLAGGCRLDKLDSEAFLAQAREYETSGDMRDGVLKLLTWSCRPIRSRCCGLPP